MSNVNSQLFTPASGAYSDINRLIRCRFAAKSLSLKPQRRALSNLAGPHKTHFRGRGIDFDEVRAYQPGDDIRSIDWRVTARSGKPHTKLYKEERERPVMIALDQRQNMFFGSRCCFKSVLATELAAYIAWAALAQNDRVGGAVFGAQHHEVKAKRSHHNVLRLLQLADAANRELNRNSSIGESLQTALQQLNRIIKPGSAVFVISDFHDLDDAAIKQLYLLSRHNDVTCLLTYDHMEQELPPPGMYALSDGKQRHTVDTKPVTSREAYREAFTQRLQELSLNLGRLGIVLVPVATHEAPMTVLQKHLAPSNPRQQTGGIHG